MWLENKNQMESEIVRILDLSKYSHVSSTEEVTGGWRKLHDSELSVFIYTLY